MGEVKADREQGKGGLRGIVEAESSRSAGGGGLEGDKGKDKGENERNGDWIAKARCQR